MANIDTDLRCYLTNSGIAAENNAIQLGRKLPIKEMVFGSGLLLDSEDPRNQTAMLAEELAVPCVMVTHDDNVTLLTFKGDIPVDVGGFNINEVAIRLEDGTIYGYARGAGDYKPTPEQGATESIRYVVDMYTTNVAVLECKVDLSTVYTDYEDLEAVRVEAASNLQAHVDHENPHPQYPLVSGIQFGLYQPDRIYSCGEICYTKDQETGELSYWQWYSNIESLAGKSPLLEENRHVGWTDSTKPFYWLPYTGDQFGMPFYWLDTTAPEWAVMEVNVDLPIAVYWRLARRYPDLVNGSVINTGEIRAEFLRVLDQGRGFDSGRVINSHQRGSLNMGDDGNDVVTPSFRLAGNYADSHGLDPVELSYLNEHYPTREFVSVSRTLNDVYRNSTIYHGIQRPSNVARPMAIAI